MSPVETMTPPRLTVNPTRARSAWDQGAKLLSWGLLAWQAILPWTAAHFITQDGAAHLYNGVVARSLWLDPHSPYAAAYDLQSNFLPNWGSTVLLGLTATLFGVPHAEQALMSLLVLAGYACFVYAVRSIPGAPTRWSPLANAVLTSYFLYRGYYNLYLGMVLLLAMMGYYLRHAADFTLRCALVLGGLLVVLFFIHIVPAALSLVAVTVLFGWVAVLVPLVGLRTWPERRAHFESLRLPAAHVFCALAPAALLLATFAANVDAGHFPSEAAEAFHAFPMNAFYIGANRIGRLELLSPALLAYVVCAVFLLRRREWLTPRGGVAALMAILFGMYLFVPNAGFGGGEVKIRFAWAFFLCGGLLAMTVARLRRFNSVFGIYLGLLLAGSLLTVQDTNAPASQLLDEYLQAYAVIPAKATFVRVKYHIPKIRRERGIPYDSPSDLFYHGDSFAAARQGALNLSDYEAPSGVFPVIYSPRVPGEFQGYFWELESPHADTPKHLQEVLEHSPLKLEYVAVLGELSAAGNDSLGGMIAMLEAQGATLVSSASGREEPFVRVYRTRAAAH